MNNGIRYEDSPSPTFDIISQNISHFFIRYSRILYRVGNISMAQLALHRCDVAGLVNDVARIAPTKQ